MSKNKKHLFVLYSLIFLLLFIFSIQNQRLKNTTPPNHIQIRQFSITTQSQQVLGKFALIIGDSITEALSLINYQGMPVLNGGMGGGGIQSAYDLLDKVTIKPAIIIIAIGVNDSVKKNESKLSLNEWEAKYRLTVTKAKSLTDHLILSTIIPVEPGKPLGDKYFDSELIEKMNLIIRKISKEESLNLIENDNGFKKLLTSKTIYTIDGVHLTPYGYKIWKKNLEHAIN